MSTTKLGNATAGAIFSECMQYRYVLWRRWNELIAGEEPKRVAFLMLNPSTATHEVLDPTITRCIAYAKLWGFDGLYVLNCFAYRATQPADMKAFLEPIGPENTKYIKAVAKKADMIVCAWGNHGEYLRRCDDVVEALKDYDLHALKVTSSGQPWHPLYLAKDLEPVLWRPKQS